VGTDTRRAGREANAALPAIRLEDKSEDRRELSDKIMPPFDVIWYVTLYYITLDPIS